MARTSRHHARSPHLLNADEERDLSAFLSAGTLPPVLEASIEEYIGAKTGKDFTDPVLLDRLRTAITAQKDDYWKPVRQRKLRYTRGYSVLAYLAYHFPVSFMQAEYLLAMLARAALLRKEMVILDAGTGPGAVPFAVADFWSRLPDARADVFSLERSEENIEAFLFLRERFVPRGGNASIKPPMRADITVFDPADLPRNPDLITFSHVLNEVFSGDIEQRAELVMKFASRLAPGGLILIAEPAEETSSTELRILSAALRRRGLFIHSPCPFIREIRCIPDRCWSFTEEPGIRPTRLMQRLAGPKEAYRFVNTDIKYSYVVMHTQDEKRRVPGAVNDLSAVSLDAIDRYMGQRVTLIAARMSGNLGDGKTRIFRICDGTGQKPAFAVLPAYHITAGNRAFLTAPYGAVLRMEDVLVRFNPKRDAWNLLVSRNSRICPAGN